MVKEKGNKNGEERKRVKEENIYRMIKKRCCKERDDGLVCRRV